MATSSSVLSISSSFKTTRNCTSKTLQNPLFSKYHDPTSFSSHHPCLSSRKLFRVQATILKEEKEEKQVFVQETFKPKTFTHESPPQSSSSTALETWITKLEQSINVLLTDSVIKILDTLYHDRDYARFFVLETIARVPYFAFMSVLHMYESFGWWRRADYLKVHFAESWNEMHHLLIMEITYLSVLRATRIQLMTNLSRHEEDLKKMPAPEVAVKYYTEGDLYLFDEFHTSRAPNSRMPKIENLYDVFLNIRDDEAEHCKTMKACQTHGNLRSPHSFPEDAFEDDPGCELSQADCEGIVDCIKKSVVSPPS